MNAGVSYWRMIWPESGPLLAGVGGIIGLLSDVGGFVGDIPAPWVWVPLALGLSLAVLLFAPCRRRVLAELPQKHEEAYDCRVCNVFRVGLFACLVCAMLALAVIIALVASFLGVYLSFFLDSAPAPTIVVLLSIAFIAAFVWSVVRTARLEGLPTPAS